MANTLRVLESDPATVLTGLETEMETFEAHRAELVARAVGKFVLIKGDRILGIFETQDEAIAHGWTELGYVPIFVKEIAEVDRVERL